MNEEQLKKAIAERVKAISANTTGKSAMAELIVEMVEPHRLALDVFNLFLPVRSLKPGDSVQKKVRKGRFPTRTFVPGTNHLSDAVITQDKTAFIFDALIAGANCNLWELESGEVGTVESLRSDLRSDLIDNIVSKIFNLLVTVWNSTDTPNNYTDASSTGITATVLDAMIENILETSGSVTAIIGQRRALFPIYEFSTSVPVVTVVGQSGTAIPTDRFPEFYNNNKITSYKGIPVVELGQIFANDLPDVNRKLIRSDLILVIGDNAGEIALMNDVQYWDFTDGRVQPPQYQTHAMQQYGLILDAIERIGIIKGNT